MGEKWNNLYLDANTTHLDFTISCPIILSTNKVAHLEGRYPFRFENAWINNKKYKKIVRKAWSSRTNESLMYQPVRKCKTVKHKSIKWAKNKYNHIKNQLIRVKNRLTEIQKVY